MLNTNDILVRVIINWNSISAGWLCGADNVNSRRWWHPSGSDAGCMRMRVGKLLFCGIHDCTGIEWRRIQRRQRPHITSQSSSVIRLTTARRRAIQFNFRSNFRQIIDGRGRQDNALEWRLQYTERQRCIKHRSSRFGDTDFIVVVASRSRRSQWRLKRRTGRRRTTW